MWSGHERAEEERSARWKQRRNKETRRDIMNKEMKRILMAGVCGMGLMMGLPVYGQVGSLSLESIYQKDHGGFGGNAGLMLPIITSPVGQFYTMLEGGWREGYNEGGNPSGSFGLGYRFLPGGLSGMGVGVSGSFDMQRSDGGNMFYGTTVGLELITPIGLNISMNGYIPVMDKTKRAGGSAASSTQPTVLELRDKVAGSCDLGNLNRVCVPVLVGGSNSQNLEIIERNRWSMDVNMSYRLPFFNSVDIVPHVGVYLGDREGKQLKGIQGGVDVGIMLGGGVQLTMSAQAKHDREVETVAEFGLGIRVNFGSAEAVNDPRQRMLAQAPRRMSVNERRPEVITRQDSAVVVNEEGVRWDKTGVEVSEIRFVNDANGAQAVAQAAALAEGGILVVDGVVNLPAGGPVAISGNNKGVVGGGTDLNFEGMISNTPVTYTTPGTRGKFVQMNNVSTTFSINASNNIYVNRLDIEDNNIEKAVIIARSSRVVIDDVNIKVNEGMGGGLLLMNNQQINIRNVEISGYIKDAALIVNNTDNSLIENVRINLVENRGGRRAPELTAVLITQGSANVTFKDLQLDGFNQSGTRAFVSYQNQNMLFSVSNLQISNFTEYAFVLDDQTNVQDLTPTVHQVTNVESVCLADPSVAGVITLNDASTCGEND